MSAADVTVPGTRVPTPYPIDMYELMPGVYRREDVGLGYPLEALLDILSTEASALQRDIAGLWDDFFVETTHEWAIPYIAELIGSTPLHKVSGTWRADVAKTISYRRRKGTILMLEDLAAAVTGWPARVVPYFEELEWAQHLDHLRRRSAQVQGRVDRVGTVNVSNIDALDRIGGAFDDIVRSVDVRPFEDARGRHNIKKIGFFAWRLRSYHLEDALPRPSVGHPRGYHFSPLGNSAPLFSNDRPHPQVRTSEWDVPTPIRPLALLADLDAAALIQERVTAAELANGATAAAAAEAGRLAGTNSVYYGPGDDQSLFVAVGAPGAEVAIPASRVTVCNLSTWREPPAGKDAAVDPVLGRLTLAAAIAPADGERVRASYCYGFSGAPEAHIGGGPYDRVPPVAAGRPMPSETEFRANVSKTAPLAVGTYRTIKAAITAWTGSASPPSSAVVEILDNATYREGNFVIEIPRDSRLEIRSADRRRPLLRVTRLRFFSEENATIVLDGLAVVGDALRIGAGIEAASVRHCTLVPGRDFDSAGDPTNPAVASILSRQTSTGAALTIANSIVGPIRVPAEGWSIVASDSIIDSLTDAVAIGGREGTYGPLCDLRRVTVLGDVRVRSIGYASDVIFAGDVIVERTQSGCIRFSYVPDGSTTPRRYRCQPDMALQDAPSGQLNSIRSRLRPRFTSRRYGQPGYAQLALDAAAEIKTGAEFETEMGAFNRILEPRRVANLRIRLEEYLPAGLEPGLIFAT
jgi:hypothetical protein